MTRRKPTARKSAARKPRSRATRPRLFTPARQRELVGVLLVVLAVITLLTFVSHGGALTRRWVGGLQWALGWAAYASPIAVGALGAWLILDSMDGEADVRWERPLGGLVLFLSAVALLHLTTSLMLEGRTMRALAEASAGGGWVGYAIANALVLNLGTAPSLAALIVFGAVGAVLVAGWSMRHAGAAAGSGARGAVASLWAARPHLDGLRVRRLTRTAVPSRPEASPEALPPVEPEEPRPAETASAPVPRRATEGAPGRAGTAAPPRREWALPPLDGVLEEAVEAEQSMDDAETMARVIETTLAEFGIPATVVKISRGPAITQFGLEPGFVDRGGRRSRVKVSRITSLQNDLALALAASPIRIQAPVPGRPYVGVEVPNAATSLVSLRGVLESDAFAKVAGKGVLPIALGRNTSGRAVAADLASMPHLLVAGATGSGKSVAINSIVCTLLMTHTPETLKLLLVDPKRVEMVQYRGLPHLAAPVVVEIERVIGVLQWAVREMDRRYRTFAEVGARNLEAYNQIMVEGGQPVLPYLVIFIDELADLMMVAPEEAERLITRLAQLARATGIHLVLATQRPSVDVVTGLIKANFPSRIAFAVSSSIDSRVILDSVGADKLLGRGDMLYMASDDSKLRRLQGCFVSDAEIERLTRYWKRAAVSDRPATDTALTLGLPEPLIQTELWEGMIEPAPVVDRDALFDDAVAVIRQHNTASTSFLQRKLRIGYSRAARLLDQLEEAGLVGAAHGNQPREVLVGANDAQAEGEVDGAQPGPDDGAADDPALRPWLGPTAGAE